MGSAEAVRVGWGWGVGGTTVQKNTLPQPGEAHRPIHVLLDQRPLVLMLTPVLLGAHRGFEHFTWSSPTPDILTKKYSLVAQIVVAIYYLQTYHHHYQLGLKLILNPPTSDPKR